MSATHRKKGYRKKSPKSQQKRNQPCREKNDGSIALAPQLSTEKGPRHRIKGKNLVKGAPCRKDRARMCQRQESGLDKNSSFLEGSREEDGGKDWRKFVKRTTAPPSSIKKQEIQKKVGKPEVQKEAA